MNAYKLIVINGIEIKNVKTEKVANFKMVGYIYMLTK